MTARDAPHNVIFITVDAWRADFTGSFEGVPLVPALDRLAPMTARFDRVWSNAPWTTPAIVSMLTGQRPERHGAHYAWSTPPQGGPSVAQALGAAGWRCPNLVYLNRLDNYANLGYRAEDAPDYPKNPEDPSLIEAIRHHGSSKHPYFLWFHYKWVHLPYWADAESQAALGVDEGALPERVRASVGSQFVVPRGQFSLEPGDRPDVVRMYAACVRRMGVWLDGVLEAVQASPSRERTCVVLSADHGDELLEHGHVGHASTAHHGTLFEEVLRIPLIVIDPRVEGFRRVDTPAQGLDLHATLLSLAGCPAEAPGESLDLSPAIFGDPKALEGRGARIFSFHSARAGYLTPREQEGQVIRGLTDGRHKIIEERYEERRLALYDLALDPQEQRPVERGALLDLWAARLDDEP